MRVELDRGALFALASDTRLDILRAMQPMRRTVTQLSVAIGIDKAAVFRHLKTLEEGGLVKRYEDHGFVYYGLSWKARDIISPGENTRIVILLSVYALAAVLAVAVSWFLLQGEFADPFDPPRSPADPYPDPVRQILAVASLLTVVSSALAAAVWASIRLVRGKRQPMAPDDDEVPSCGNPR